MEWMNVYRPSLTKRKNYALEKELRIVSQYFNGYNENGEVKISDEEGINIKINSDILIEKIHLAPYAKNWFRVLIRDLLKKYDVPKEVFYSEL